LFIVPLNSKKRFVRYDRFCRTCGRFFRKPKIRKI